MDDVTTEIRGAYMRSSNGAVEMVSSQVAVRLSETRDEIDRVDDEGTRRVRPNWTSAIFPSRGI